VEVNRQILVTFKLSRSRFSGIAQNMRWPEWALNTTRAPCGSVGSAAFRAVNWQSGSGFVLVHIRGTAPRQV